MKKSFLSNAALVFVLLLSFSLLSVKPSAISTTSVSATSVSTVSTELPNSSKVLSARLLNMLNHSFVYNEAFDSVEDMVNASMPALLEMRDKDNEDYISEDFVKSYIYNMYGAEIDDFSDLNKDFPRLDGYVYIIPQGFTVYRHKIESLSVNEDGSITVVTRVTLDSHDEASTVKTAVSLFVKNSSSQFGYNIISSDIFDSVNGI